MIALLTLVAMALAGPAAAQKDPFHPLIDPNAAGSGSVPSTDAGGSATGGSTTGQPPVGSDSLANTGMDVSPWLAIAYGLLAIGGGTLVLVRMYRPAPVRQH